MQGIFGYGNKFFGGAVMSRLEWKICGFLS